LRRFLPPEVVPDVREYIPAKCAVKMTVSIHDGEREAVLSRGRPFWPPAPSARRVAARTHSISSVPRRVELPDISIGDRAERRPEPIAATRVFATKPLVRFRDPKPRLLIGKRVRGYDILGATSHPPPPDRETR
jgi:hypothetical protein